jgi:hypothetical protein
MFILNCEIIIGGFNFSAVTEVTVKRSIHSFVDTANITIPASAQLTTSGELPTQSVTRTAMIFKEGDPVEIWLGYDGDLQLEFEGFVRRVNGATPCIIECEGYSWLLKRKNIHKVYPPTSLKQMLEELVQGTGITLSENIPDVEIRQVAFSHSNGTAVLDWIKNNLYLAVYFMGKELYAGLSYTELPERAIYVPGRVFKNGSIAPLDYEKVQTAVPYQLGWNVVKDDQLKFRKASDVKIRVKAVCFDEQNKPREKMAGDTDGAIRTIFVPDLRSDKELLAVAEAKANMLRYDGYEGKLTTFLQPFALPGFKTRLKDPTYKDREGTYLIESTEVKFGSGGGRRICEIGVKISSK